MTQPMELLCKKVWHGFRAPPLATPIGHGPNEPRATERGRDA
ncbi:hypothetical protein WMF11_19180 [Sorangium sp. So ce295]